MHKFEQLEVWTLAIEYADLCYSIAEKLPISTLSIVVAT